MSGGLLLGLLVGFSANAILYIYLYTRCPALVVQQQRK
jgi:hypothetical protein